MISESNCINIVHVSMSVNIFDIFSYHSDKNCSHLPKNLAHPNFCKIFQVPLKKFFKKILASDLKAIGGGSGVIFACDIHMEVPIAGVSTLFTE